MFTVSFLSSLYLLTCQDSLEIIVIACALYYLALWLSKDITKRLLTYFYGLCLVGLAAQVLKLTTISLLFILCTPLICVLFIFFHHHTLRKNMIGTRNISARSSDHTEWIELLIRSCLQASHHNKEIFFIIEKRDSISSFLATPFSFHAPLNQDLLDLVVTSELYAPQKMIWLSANGKIKGINSEWNFPAGIMYHTHLKEIDELWQYEALFVTEKTDAFLLVKNPGSPLFIVCLAGELMHLTTQQVLHILKEYILMGHTPTLFNQKGTTYDHSLQVSIHKQHHP